MLRSFRISTDGFRAVNWVTLRAQGQEAEKIIARLESWFLSMHEGPKFDLQTPCKKLGMVASAFKPCGDRSNPWTWWSSSIDYLVSPRFQ